MSHDHDRMCRCQAEHRPAPLELHEHHILPLYLGGQDVEANRVWLCPTAHLGITHELLRAMLRERRVITYAEFSGRYEQPVNRYAYGLALRAWTEHTARSNGGQAA